jgi:hypothetical protein
VVFRRSNIFECKSGEYLASQNTVTRKFKSFKCVLKIFEIDEVRLEILLWTFKRDS